MPSKSMSAVKPTWNVPSGARSPTGQFAREGGQPSRIVRIMDPSVALAHKIAAWNERRLGRDLYDVYFLFSRIDTNPDRTVLESRLSHFESRIPKLRKKKTMSMQELLDALAEERVSLDDAKIESELGALLSIEERAGLALRMKSAIAALMDVLSSTDD